MNVLEVIRSYYHCRINYWQCTVFWRYIVGNFY